MYMKRAPKKPILKPFQEEQQSPVGQPRKPTIRGCRLLKGWNRFPFINSTVKAFGECCSPRQHGENGTTRLQYYLQFAHSVETLTRRFCRQRRNKNHNKKNLQASRSRSNSPNNKPYREVGFYLGGGVRVLQPVCRSGQKGSNNDGTDLKRNGTVGAQHGKVTMGGDFLS